MKKVLCILLAVLLLTGCTGNAAPEAVSTEVPDPVTPFSGTAEQATSAGAEYTSRFDHVTEITLSDEDILVDTLESGEIIEGLVSVTNDIIYYEDKDIYDSGNPYGEGTDADKHTAQEAAAHTVLNILKPGAYRIRGTLSAGQIRIDLGDDAYDDPNAVVELILDNVDITCTVAPAILFLNTYECDGNWSTETAKPDLDTSNAGANLILEGENTVSGAYVAKIYKDAEGEKKLWKQDGAIYSYTSMNVFGPGGLDLYAANEGLDTELHLTINGGDISIRSDNDGINTNEDGVSVTTINGGNVHIIAGLGEEGDGIDSNGYLVINGGTVVASANPAADAGMDSDLGSFIHGGTVVALGSAMDWAESDSGQVTMNLQFAQHQKGAIVVSDPEGRVIFAYDPSEDEVLGENVRQYMGAILSCPGFRQGDSYLVYAGDAQMAYSGTDVQMRPGGMGGFGGQWPEGERPEMPEDGFDGHQPEGDFSGNPGEMPEDFGGEMPDGFTPPDGKPPQMPEDQRPEMSQNGDRGRNPMDGMGAGEATNTLFYMQDMVNFFSGIATVTE